MKKFFLCLLFSWGALWADVRVPEPWNPGWFDVLGKNPARKSSDFKLGLLWTEPMEGVDYEVFGLFSEWGNDRYRLGASFASSFLDSLYRSENFGVELSVALSALLLGLGGNVDIQVIPGEATWWRAVGRAGNFLEWKLSILGWDLGKLSVGFRTRSLAGNILWIQDKRFWCEAAFFYQRPLGFIVALGEKIRLGILELQGSVAYPGPRIGVGVSVGIRNWGAAFGVHRDGDYMNSRMGGLFYRKKRESDKVKSKF